MKSRLLVLIFITFFACSERTTDKSIIIGVDSDIENIYPLYAYNLYEGIISEILYLTPFAHQWNDKEHSLETYPRMVDSWQWGKDSTSVKLSLREDMNWSDGEKITVDDLVFSFDLYSDPRVQSKFYGSFNNFITDSDNRIIIEETFLRENDYSVTVKFKDNSYPTLFEIDLPILPEHILGKLDRNNFNTQLENTATVTSGPFKLGRWEKQQFLTLERAGFSFIKGEGNADRIVFKVVPDYNSRKTQLLKEELDFIEQLRPEDAAGLLTDDNFILKKVKGRDYDYVGWNNLSPESDKPHPLFGNPEIRLALTNAINRQEILSQYLGEFGDAAAGPIPPYFLYDSGSSNYKISYNPDKAVEILNRLGWTDTDKDGILDKNGKNFSFELAVASGNPRRDFAANIIKNNLTQIGIEVNIVNHEFGIFVDNLFEHKFDAWISGWFVPLPVDLKSYWYSDLEKTPLNFPAYQSEETDKFIDTITKTRDNKTLKKLYSSFNEKLYKDQPVSFLFWVDNVIAINRKVSNCRIDPLGPVQDVWNWKIN